MPCNIQERPDSVAKYISYGQSFMIGSFFNSYFLLGQTCHGYKTDRWKTHTEEGRWPLSLPWHRVWLVIWRDGSVCSDSCPCLRTSFCPSIYSNMREIWLQWLHHSAVRVCPRNRRAHTNTQGSVPVQTGGTGVTSNHVGVGHFTTTYLFTPALPIPEISISLTYLRV